MTHPAANPFAALAPHSLLYVPGHKARALDKARGLAADAIIIDLEDAVPDADKAAARDGALVALNAGFQGKAVLLRVNAPSSRHHAADCAIASTAGWDAVVLPKVDGPADIDAAQLSGPVPLVAMVESPAAVFAAQAIAAHSRVCGLIAGLNDLAHDLKLPDANDRSAMLVAMQMMVLAARAAGIAVFDGVCNAIDDPAPTAVQAAEAHRLGFDGKTLIHPVQVEPANRAFAPAPDRLADAVALIAAASGGAERFGDRMIEAMHVASARALIDETSLRAARRRAMAAP